MSAINEALASPHEFSHKGKTFEVSLITQKVKAEFEKKLFGRAKMAAQEMRSLMDKEDYLAFLQHLNDDYIAGAYAFESDRGVKSVASVTGFSMLAGLLFGCDESEMLNLVTESPEEVKLLIRTIFVESFPALEGKLLENEAGAKKKEEALLENEAEAKKKEEADPKH